MGGPRFKKEGVENVGSMALQKALPLASGCCQNGRIRKQCLDRLIK